MAVFELPTKPLRKSLLWQLQAQYYEEGGLASWDNGIVPNWITSNNFIGNEFGTALIYTLRDMLNTQRLNPQEPIYIVELGAGTGKFAHLCIATLIEKLPILTRTSSLSLSLRKLKLKYVMTDFSSNPIVEWLKNPVLMKYVEQGILDFGLFDAHRSQSIALWHEQRTLVANGTDIMNPLFVISNYTFDSLVHDSFRIIGSSDDRIQSSNSKDHTNNGEHKESNNNTVCEGRLCIKSKLTNEKQSILNDPTIDPSIFLRMDNTWEYKPLTRNEVDTYYNEDTDAGITEDMANEMNYILDWYRKHAFSCPANVTNIAARHALDTFGDKLSSFQSDAITSSDPSNTSSSSASFTFPFPVGSLQCLHNLRKLGQTGGLIVFIADKGFSNPYYFRGIGNVDIHIHGSISMMVNYHALQLWTESQGGNVLITSDDDVHIKIGILTILPPLPTVSEPEQASSSNLSTNGFDIRIDLPLLTDIFYDRLQKFGPSEFWDLQNIFPDSFSSSSYQRKGHTGSTLNIIPNNAPTKTNITETISAYVDSDSENESAVRPNPHSFTHSFPSSSSSTSSPGTVSALSSYSAPITLRSAIALCRLSNWDPDMFYKFRDLIASRLPSLSPPRRQQIFDGISIMWNKAFPSPGSRQEYDVSFEIGRIFYLTNDYKRALTFFIESLNKTGPHATTYFNLAMCCYHMQQYRYAKHWLEQAIAYADENPTETDGGDYPLARTWLQMCEEELLVESSMESGHAVVIPSNNDKVLTDKRNRPSLVDDQEKSETVDLPSSTTSSSSSPTTSSSSPSLQRLILPGRSNVKLYI